ncbi:MAG TPA: PAS domain-containing sensor histidine kinase [candidate division Zixibacteria bacterium]|nr:PAS domain-containing sensor histidine kinase [candidate division Zixibacteria bacterium]
MTSPSNPPSPREPGESRITLDREQAMQLLVDAVTDYAIFLIDADGYVQTWNPGAERIKGYTAAEIIGQHFSRFYTPEDQAAGLPQRRLREAAEQGRVEDESWRVRADGSRFWANVVITALRAPDGSVQGFVKITRDLTERRAVEERERMLHAEERAREAAHQALRARERFLSIASHELRTPIATVQLAVEAMARAHALGTLDDERLSRSLTRLANASRRLTTLVNELLDVARLESERMSFQLRTIDVGDVVAEVVERFQDADQGDRLRYRRLSPAVARVDPLRIDQVVTNLVENALKYSPSSAPVDVECGGDEAGATIRVTDQGIGLDEAADRWLFEPFGRGENAGTAEGIGLGLYISRQIVDAHGGRLQATSPGLGRGSTFEVWLPRSGPS